MENDASSDMATAVSAGRHCRKLVVDMVKVQTVFQGLSIVNRRTIVFVGNCQLGALAALYRAAVPPELGNEVIYLPSYEAASADQLRQIAEADILLKQVLDFAPRIGDLATNAAVHLVPHVTAAFLWPCSGQPHPKNAPHRYSDGSGPYNGELGDSFLNRMILDEVDPTEAVQRYMAIDFAATRRVDRMQEILMEKQRSRDRACGYAFADYIDANFRSMNLFRSPNHPEMPLSLLLASEVFGRLGVDAGVIESLLAKPPIALFPPTETPIHPSIISHYGLKYCHAETRYRYFDEGRYTCEEFAARYMIYEWNPLLGEGYELMRAGNREAAIDTLGQAVERSPRSPVACSVLSDLLAVSGRLTDAVEIALRAHELEPDNNHYLARYRHLASQLSAPKYDHAEAR